MELIHQYSFYLHVAVGSCALLLFWIPVFARKGSVDHKRFGRYFAWVMYTVALTGFVMAGFDLAMPLSVHVQPEGLTEEALAQQAQTVRESATFLFSLSILVIVTTRQGWLSILHRENRRVLRTPLHVGLCCALIAVGLLLLSTGIRYGNTLFVIFSILEISVGVGAIRYSFKSVLKPKEWWIEHLSGLIASGIAAYTAFFVFGGSRLLSGILTGPFSGLSIIFWVSPGIIGGVAIALLSNKYRKRFGEAASRATPEAT